MLAITFCLDSGFVEKQASQDFSKVSQVAIFFGYEYFLFKWPTQNAKFAILLFLKDQSG